MSIIRIGATKKYASHWGQAFGKDSPSQAETPAEKTAAKKGTPKKKSAGGKGK